MACEWDHGAGAAGVGAVPALTGSVLGEVWGSDLGGVWGEPRLLVLKSRQILRKSGQCGQVDCVAARHCGAMDHSEPSCDGPHGDGPDCGGLSHWGLDHSSPGGLFPKEAMGAGGHLLWAVLLDVPMFVQSVPCAAGTYRGSHSSAPCLGWWQRCWGPLSPTKHSEDFVPMLASLPIALGMYRSHGRRMRTEGPSYARSTKSFSWLQAYSPQQRHPGYAFRA